MELKGTPVVVLGMLRSGTSSVAKALHKLGVYLGEPDQLKAPDEHNQDGYWEHQEVRLANEQVLSALGMGWDPARMMPNDWRDYERVDRQIEQTKALFRNRFAGKELWGWKDPPTTMIVPFYCEVFNQLGVQPLFAICVRNPLDVAASMVRRSTSQTSEQQVIGLWLQYTLSALHDTIGQRRVVLVFDDFLANPAERLRSAVATVPGWAPTDRDWEAVKAVPRKDLNHGAGNVGVLDSFEPSIVKRVYELCIQMAVATKAINEGDFDPAVTALWDEFQSWRALSPTSPDVASRLSLKWMVAGNTAPDLVSAKYVPSLKRQTAALDIDVPAGSVVVGEWITRPGTILIRKVELVAGGGRTQIQPDALPGVGLTHVDGIAVWTVTGGGEHFAFQVRVGGKQRFEVEFAQDVSAYEIARIASAAGQESAFWRKKVGELESRARTGASR